jgi:hypothetical protein
LEERGVSAEEKFDRRICDLIRMMGSDVEAERHAAVDAFYRHFKSHGVSVTAFGCALENGSFTDAQRDRVKDAAFAEGVARGRREATEELAAFGLNPDGSPKSAEIVRYLKNNVHLVPPGKSREVRRRVGRGERPLPKAWSRGLSVLDFLSHRRKAVMSVAVNETAVRQFVETISEHVTKLANGSGRGVLQLCQLSPHDVKLIPSRFRLDDIDGIVAASISAANAGLNAYIEARTVPPGLRACARGGIDDTEFVFGLVVDSDGDKGKAGTLVARPSITVETSPGNKQHWYLFDRPVSAARAKTIGDALRALTGSDDDTGVVTQPYRIAGTRNFPSKA